MPSNKKIYRCKAHQYQHEYTVCPACGCQYCDRIWEACPRDSWHPAHGGTTEEIGQRYSELNGVRVEGGS
jgi:hypothetical protein